MTSGPLPTNLGDRVPLHPNPLRKGDEWTEDLLPAHTPPFQAVWTFETVVKYVQVDPGFRTGIVVDFRRAKRSETG